MILRAHQLAVLNDTSKYVLAGWGRVTGKTTMIASLLEHTRGKILVVFRDNASMSLFIKALEHLGLETLLLGDTTRLITSTPKALIEDAFSESYEKVILDEPAFLPSELVLDALKIDAKQVYFIGTPRPCKGDLIDAFTILYRLRDSIGISYHGEASTLEEEAKKEYAKWLGEERYKSDILAQFQESKGENIDV